MPNFLDCTFHETKMATHAHTVPEGQDHGEGFLFGRVLVLSGNLGKQTKFLGDGRFWNISSTWLCTGDGRY